MNALPFRPDRKLTDVLKENRFTLSAEIIPPRNGAEQRGILEQIQALIGAGAQFLAVTKGAGGSLRGGSLPIAQAIKENFGVPCIAHFTCRDITPADVENQLMDHHYFGIRNILALRGDPPDGQPNWTPAPGGYHYAYQLIEQIKKLNDGEFLTRAGTGPNASGSKERTDFCIGCAVYPEAEKLDEQIGYYKLKADAGAQYAITDMLYDVDQYSRFVEKSAKLGISLPVLPGTRVLKSKIQALKMMQKFKVKVPAYVLDKLPEVETADSFMIGVELALDFADRLKSAGAPGLHFFVIGNTIGAATSLKTLAMKGKIG